MVLLTGLTLIVFSSFLLPASGDYIDPVDCKVVFYYGPSYSDSVSYPLPTASAVVTHPKFIHNKTVLFIPDYHEPQLEGYQSHYTIDAYLKSDDVNMLFLDWGAPVVPDDEVKDPLLSVLVPETSDWLAEMHELIDWQGFHVLAYAKGVEFISNVVHDLYRKTQIRIHRTTTLAPPQELIVEGRYVYEDKNLITEFIDAIHTDIGGQGSNVSRAHADFYPNGGTAPQPGCPNEGLCSRRRSFRYYAVSVNVEFAFCGYPADSYEEFESKSKDQLGTPIYMGRYCPSSARGKYYLDTSSWSPYGEGC